MQKLAVFAMSTVQCKNDCTLTEFFKPHSIMDTANHLPIARDSVERRGQRLQVCKMFCKYQHFVQGLIIRDTVQLKLCTIAQLVIMTYPVSDVDSLLIVSSAESAAAFFSVALGQSSLFGVVLRCNAYALQPADYSRMRIVHYCHTFDRVVHTLTRLDGS
ncbi:hypothetical protein ABBQ32_005747 [Trebouxia sp. C0010 RCD-2024]